MEAPRLDRRNRRRRAAVVLSYWDVPFDADVVPFADWPLMADVERLVRAPPALPLRCLGDVLAAQGIMPKADRRVRRWHDSTVSEDDCVRARIGYRRWRSAAVSFAYGSIQ
jgi:hypothetical protein